MGACAWKRFEPARAIPSLTEVHMALMRKTILGFMLAATTGELAFGYLNEDSEVRPGPGTTNANLFR